MGDAALNLRPSADRHDPVVDALIDRLPRQGATWPLEQRLVWLRMMVMGFDLAYGIEAPIEIKLAGVPAVMAADVAGAPAGGEALRMETSKPVEVGPRLGKKRREADQQYVICVDGMAWKGNKLMLPAELGPGDRLWDFRDGEQPLDAVVWADGEKRLANELPAIDVLKG